MANKKVNILDDVSKLTTIPYTSLTKICKQEIYCICNAVEEAVLAEEPITYANIGIGTIIIQVQDEQVCYQFVPSKFMSQHIADTVVNKKNPLVAELDETLVERILSTYKDLL